MLLSGYKYYSFCMVGQWSIEIPMFSLAKVIAKNKATGKLPL